jgi:glycolate oxidase iron-sulfur subunit
VNDQTLRNKLVETADQCVKCGLCLPHCPTYRVRQDEAESPRGRISLIQGLAEKQLADTPRLAAHLSSCLECRACETVCPSLVTFGSLMDDARALRARNLSPWALAGKKARLKVLSSDWGTASIAALSRLYRFAGLAYLAEKIGLPDGSRLRAHHRLAMQMSCPERPPEVEAPDQGRMQTLALFLGCIAKAAQPGLSQAACRVLGRLGYGVLIPDDQCCCGAMHRHAGFPLEADRLIARNATAFAKMRTLVTASACAAELRAHPNLSQAQEICRFLADHQWPRNILRPLPERIAVHEPCSHRNVLRDASAAYDLLRQVPGLELVSLENNAFCCGAAGTYLLDDPTMSSVLLSPKIEHLRELGVGTLATTNTGCAMHLVAGAREAGLDLEVVHPVELIARQLTDRVEPELPTAHNPEKTQTTDPFARR